MTDPKFPFGWLDGRGRWIGLAWGVAEATLFFVVPDLVLTWAALGGRRRGSVQLTLIVAGSLLGGALLYLWAAQDAESPRRLVSQVPFVTSAMFQSTSADLDSHGLTAMLMGPFSGIPYKVYAVQAPAHGGLALFLLFSVPARLERLLGSGLLFLALGALQRRYVPTKLRLGLMVWALFWSLSYAFYWRIL